MKIIKLLALLCAAVSPALAQTTVSGTKVPDSSGTGTLLVSGQWCFGSTCLAVTNGAFSGSVTAGTQSVTVKNSYGNVFLTVPNVVVGAIAFNWDLYVLPLNQTAVGVGIPVLACAPGSTYEQIDSAPPYQVWTCVKYADQAIWAAPGGGPALGSGFYAGIGAPSFACTVPCTYISTDTHALYTVSGDSGSSSSNWIEIAGASNVSYNIQAFGAKCDGHTDDYPAILAAVAAAQLVATSGTNPGQTSPQVIVPATGSYCMFGSQIRLPSNIRLVNQGGLQALPALASGAQIVVYPSTIVAPGGVSWGGIYGGQFWGQGSGTTGPMIELDAVPNYNIENVSLAENGGVGIQINASERVTIIQPQIYSVRQPIMGSGANNEIRIENPKILYPGGVDAVGAYPAYSYSPNAVNGQMPCPYSQGYLRPCTATSGANTPIVPYTFTGAINISGDAINIDGPGSDKGQGGGSATGFDDMPKLKVTSGFVKVESGYLEQSGPSPAAVEGGQTLYSGTSAAFGSTAISTTVNDDRNFLWQNAYASLCSDAQYYLQTYKTHAIFPPDYAAGSTAASSLGGGVEKGQFEVVSGSFCRANTGRQATFEVLSTAARGLPGGCSNPPSCSSGSAISWPAGAQIGDLAGVVSLDLSHTHINGVDSASFFGGGFAYQADNSTCASSADIVAGYCPDGFQSFQGSTNQNAALTLDSVEMFNDGTASFDAEPAIGQILCHSNCSISLQGANLSSVVPFSLDTTSTLVYNNDSYDFGPSSIRPASYPNGQTSCFTLTNPDSGRAPYSNCAGVATQNVAPTDQASGMAVPGIQYSNAFALYGGSYSAPVVVPAVSSSGGSIPAGNWETREAYVKSSPTPVGNVYSNVTISNGGSYTGNGPQMVVGGATANTFSISSFSVAAPKTITLTATASVASQYSVGGLVTIYGFGSTYGKANLSGLTIKLTSVSGSTFVGSAVRNISISTVGTTSDSASSTISYCPYWNGLASNTTGSPYSVTGVTQYLFDGYCTVSPGTSVPLQIYPVGTGTQAAQATGTLVVQGSYGQYNAPQVFSTAGSSSSVSVASPAADTQGQAAFWNLAAGPPGRSYIVQSNIPIGTAASTLASLIQDPVSPAQTFAPSDAGYNANQLSRTRAYDNRTNSGGSDGLEVADYSLVTGWDDLFTVDSLAGTTVYGNFLLPGLSGCLAANSTTGPVTGTGTACGTVTSVGDPPFYTVSNRTTTPTFTLNSQAANTVLAGPNGSSGTPTYRALVAADLPTGIPVANLSSTTTTVNGVPCSLGGANCVVSSSSAAFGAITSGTNTGNGLVVGSGSTLSPTGTGSITASSVPASGTDPYAFAVEGTDTSVNGKVACPASPYNITALTNNLHIAFTPGTGPNTSATPSMNLCGLGAVTITAIGDQPLQAGDLTTTYPDGSPTLLQIVYNSGSNHWELLNPQTGSSLSQRCSPGVLTPAENIYCVDNFPSSGGTITATNSTNMVIVPASGTTLSILGSPGFDLQFAAGKYALPAGTTNISGGGTFTIASGTTIQSISYNYYTGTGTITINNAATKTGSGTGNATLAVTPGIYNGTYTTAWDYACAEAGLYNVTSSHHVSLVLGGGSHSANQPCVILGTSSGTGVSVYGQGPGGIITRPMAFALPQYGASSSQFGSIVKANWAIGAYSYPIMLYASNPGGRYQFTQRGVGFDNTAGSAHGCEEMDGVVSVMMEDVRCSDESSGNWPSFGFGNAQIYNGNGYSGDFKVVGLDFTRLSTNSSTSFSENSQVQVNITGGSVSSTSIVAGGTVTSDDQLVPVVYNAFSQCSVNPTFAITVTGGISFGQPHAGAAGSGYVVGDVVTLVQSGSSGTAKLTVSAIGAGGSVLAFSANSTSSSNFGSGYTGTSFTANTVGTPLATTGGSGTGLMVDAQAYGALTGITTLTAGSGCANTLTGSSTGVIYAQVMRPSLTGGTYTPTQGAAGMDLNSTSDSHYYGIQGQVDGNVGFRNNNHGGNKFYGMHMIGVGGAGGGFDDEWGGQQCYECSADTISWIPFTINPNVSYNQDNFYSPTILFNAVWAPFSGAIGWYIGDLVHTVLTIRDETCGTNGEQTAGGYIQYMGPTGAAVTPGTIPGFMPSNSQECGGSVPLVTDTWFNQNVSLYGSTNGTYNSFTLGPVNPATSVTTGQNSAGLGLVDSQWNSATSKAVSSSWLYHMFANGTLEETRLDYNGGGLVDNPSGGVSAVGVVYNNASVLATSSLNVPGLYFGSEGQAWNGTSSQACRFLFLQKMTVSGTPTAAGLQLYPNCPLSSGGQFFADFTTYNIALETTTLVLGSATPATNACTGGSSSGTMQYSASTWGPTDKKAIIRLNACVGSRTYTFPSTGYLENAPGYFYSVSITPANVAVSFSGTPATSVTVTTTAATTGVITIEDF